MFLTLYLIYLIEENWSETTMVSNKEKKGNQMIWKHQPCVTTCIKIQDLQHSLSLGNLSVGTWENYIDHFPLHIQQFRLQSIMLFEICSCLPCHRKSQTMSAYKSEGLTRMYCEAKNHVLATWKQRFLYGLFDGGTLYTAKLISTSWHMIKQCWEISLIEACKQYRSLRMNQFQTFSQHLHKNSLVLWK